MITRRTVLKGAVALSASNLALPAYAKGVEIKLGYVSPQSGPLAAFSEADSYIIGKFTAAMKSQGLNFKVIVKDSQSNPNRAAEVAKELIVSDDVDLMLVASTPETTNPVCTICETERKPVISSVAPWQPWFIGQQGNPADPKTWKPFDYAYHFFWGLEDVIGVFTNLWGQIDTNKTVGALFPNDGDGNAWGNPQAGFPPVLSKLGYKLIDPGRYQDLQDDFSAQINAFRQNGVEIVTGVVIPPDFTTFWTQAKQQGYTPKIVSVGKALLFPQSVQALGKIGHNLACEVYWSPSHPFKSSLDKASSRELADGFSAATGRPWTQPIGFTNALFELAADVMKRVKDPSDGDEVAGAIARTKLETVVGPISWGSDKLPPFARKNIAKTPLVGGQWRLKDGKWDLVIVDNRTAPQIPVAGKLEPIA